ncbi:MAG: hypothetical protein QM767_27645 [Anaeromyxobacter sp.]
MSSSANRPPSVTSTAATLPKKSSVSRCSLPGRSAATNCRNEPVPWGEESFTRASPWMRCTSACARCTCSSSAAGSAASSPAGRRGWQPARARAQVVRATAGWSARRAYILLR